MIWREPVALADSPQSPRQMPRGMKSVEYWQGTNVSAVVCAFLPEASAIWYLATWELAKEDDFAERIGVFEWKFLEGEWKTRPPWRGGEEIPPTEREQLRADAHHSVTNYEAWHWTDAATFTVLDDLPRTSAFVAAMTNELQRMYPAYAAAVPSPLDGSNVLFLFLPDKAVNFIYRYQFIFFIMLFMLMWRGAFSGVLSSCTNWLLYGLSWLAHLPFAALA